jgi:uncharacterized SAM-binding protein YcdF (DUF218 family)
MAGRKICANYKDAKVCFVGGGGLAPETGTLTMKKFWQEKYPKLKNSLVKLNASNNTADNVRDIARFAKRHSSKEEIILVSSAYHTRRIAFFAKRYKLKATIISAENTLLKTKGLKDKMEQYLESFEYMLKRTMENLLMMYIMLDSDQKMVAKWRRHKRNKCDALIEI